jgi:uncharacterized protein (DUF433 family)
MNKSSATDLDYSGGGVYTLSQAGSLIGERPSTISRWLFGCSYARAALDGRAKQTSGPLWKSQYDEDVVGERLIGFNDLMELRVVRQFVKRGLSLQFIRRCLDNARIKFGDNAYPFSSKRFETDGLEIYLSTGSEAPFKDTIALSDGQYVFRKIIQRSLIAGVEFQGNVAKRWFPEQVSKPVIVLDPEISFGEPIIQASGVPTAALYGLYVANGAGSPAIQSVARIYDVTALDVRSAVKFEEGLRDKLAA